MLKWILLILVAAIIAIQFIPVDRTNPEVVDGLQMPEEVEIVMKKSCYDCHSNNTEWPWYSKAAPVSFFIANHVNEGREHLNFSNWGQYSADRQRRKIKEVWEEVEAGKMPLKSYLLLHKNAKLSDEELELLKSWTQSFLEPNFDENMIPEIEDEEE